MFAPRTFPVGRPRSLLRKLAGAQLLCERAIAQRWYSEYTFAAQEASPPAYTVPANRRLLGKRSVRAVVPARVLGPVPRSKAIAAELLPGRVPLPAV